MADGFIFGGKAVPARFDLEHGMEIWNDQIDKRPCTLADTAGSSSAPAQAKYETFGPISSNSHTESVRTRGSAISMETAMSISFKPGLDIESLREMHFGLTLRFRVG